jgi:hypothetical protein
VRALGAVICCLALLLACGCGHSRKTNTNASHVQTGSKRDATPSPPSIRAAETADAAAQELLLHPTRRPPGVSKQFEFVGGAGPGACLEMGEPAQVRVLVQPFPSLDGSTADGFNDQGVATYGQPVDVCFDGMGRGPISVSVNGPHGFTRSGLLPALPASPSYHYKDEWTSFDWVPAIESSWPLGKYVITARAGSISRNHPLTLVAPAEPGLRVLGPSTDPGNNAVPPDSQAKLFLTGFKGTGTVELLTYRTTGFAPHARFFSTAAVPVPASGNTMVEIPTGSPKSGQGAEPTFIITTRARGRTLFAPFSVFKTQKWPNMVVGALPEA